MIDQGPKAKVHEIVFDGNEVFSDDKLRGKMKKIKQPGFFNLSWLGGKTTYTEDKWLGGQEDPRGDRGRIEDYYLDNGYVTARVGQPRISYTDGKSGFFKKKPVKLMKLEVPVTEGEQYRMGELKFEGLTVLKEDFVRGFFKMKPRTRSTTTRTSRRPTRSCATSTARSATSSGRAARERSPTPSEGRRRHGEDGGGQAVLPRASSTSSATTRRGTR